MNSRTGCIWETVTGILNDPGHQQDKTNVRGNPKLLRLWLESIH